MEFILSMPIEYWITLIGMGCLGATSTKQLKDIYKEKKSLVKYNEIITNELNNILKKYEPGNNESKIKNNSEFDIIFTNTLHKLNTNAKLTPLIDKLTAYIPARYLYNFCTTIGNLKINNKEPENNSKIVRTKAEFIPNENCINIKMHQEALSHEFLHAASFRKINDYFSYCGFNLIESYNIYNNDIIISIFNGFNEGYTEVLNKRIFDTDKIDYKECYKLCEYIEILFDNKQDMEAAYFENNINLMIDTFLKYGTKDEFSYIMKKLDNYSKIPTKKRELKEDINLLCDIISRSGDNNKLQKCDFLNEKNKIKRKMQPKRLVRK